MDTFIDLLLVNDVLNANPAINEARKRVPAAGLKYLVTELVCQQTGGPCKYTGRGMKASHAHLNINEKEWQTMLTDFRRVLNNYGVPAKEQGELGGDPGKYEEGHRGQEVMESKGIAAQTRRWARETLNNSSQPKDHRGTYEPSQQVGLHFDQCGVF